MVAYGSQGSAVKQLQSELNKRGYQLDEDGVFGKKTKAAVRDYQKKNRLTMVDGIAGDETWGSLLSAPTAAEQQAAAQAVETAQAAAVPAPRQEKASSVQPGKTEAEKKDSSTGSPRQKTGTGRQSAQAAARTGTSAR